MIHPVVPMLGAVLTALTVCAVAKAVGAAEAPTTNPSDHKPLVVAYAAGWSGAKWDQLPAERLTHVIYAFANLRDGRCGLKDGDASPALQHFAGLRALKAKHPHLKTLISLGGWGGSDGFSDAAATDQARKTFALSCAQFVSTHGFDGIDIDWEYPGGGGANPEKSRPQDVRNFTLLLEEVRRQLDAQEAKDSRGGRYLLTIATSAGEHVYRRLELDRIHQPVDFINLMTYDFAGPWSPVTGFNAPLFAADPDAKAEDAAAGVKRLGADAAVRAYLAAGVPPQKLLLGVPFYGRAFAEVDNVNDGLFRPHSKKAAPVPGGGEWTYRHLATHVIGKASSTRRSWHAAAKVPWLYDAANRLMVSYDDPESLRAKVEYVRSNDLGGVMFWELSQDDDDHTLLKTLHDGLHGSGKP